MGEGLFDCSTINFLQFFSEKSFHLDRPDNRNRTPIHNAAAQGDLGVLESLIRAGSNMNLMDKDECTPLCIAVREEQKEAAKALIQSGADVNLGGGIYGSALHLAIIKGDVDLVALLLKAGADFNVTDQEGNTPLHFIMNVFSKNQAAYQQIAELLLEAGA